MWKQGFETYDQQDVFLFYGYSEEEENCLVDANSEGQEAQTEDLELCARKKRIRVFKVFTGFPQFTHPTYLYQVDKYFKAFISVTKVDINGITSMTSFTKYIVLWFY